MFDTPLKSLCALAAAAMLTACSQTPTLQMPAMPVPPAFPTSPAQASAPAVAKPASDLLWQDFFADARLKRLAHLGAALAHARKNDLAWLAAGRQHARQFAA